MVGRGVLSLALSSEAVHKPYIIKRGSVCQRFSWKMERIEYRGQNIAARRSSRREIVIDVARFAKSAGIGRAIRVLFAK